MNNLEKLTKRELIDKIKEDAKNYSKLNIAYRDMRNKNQTKKWKNEELRSEIKEIKKQNIELSILLDTLLKKKKRGKKNGK